MLGAYAREVPGNAFITLPFPWFVGGGTNHMAMRRLLSKAIFLVRPVVLGEEKYNRQWQAKLAAAALILKAKNFLCGSSKGFPSLAAALPSAPLQHG